MRLFRSALVGVLATLLLSVTTAARADPGDELRVYIVTMGPGDHPFFKFGHNAILIQPDNGPGAVFNWGTFLFDSPLLIPKFLRGRLNYWLSVSPADMTLESYKDANRTVELQELDLTAAQKVDLARRVTDNARPQNREYLYDYFWDNCSTRVRDMIDVVVGGRVKAAAGAPAALTFRDHALRLTADLIPEYIGLDLGLGSLTDRAVTRWEETFIPEVFQKLVREVRVPVAGGGNKPLVKAEQVYFRALRPDKPAQPPVWTLYFALVGVALGGLLALCGQLARRSRAARVVLGVLASVLGLVLGLCGIILVALWTLTNHRSAYANENILQLAPWTVVLVAYGVGVARGRARAVGRAYRVALAAAALALLGLLLKVVLPQNNWPFVALLLPLWAGMAVGLARLRSAPVATS